jgi:hypothetical protein
MSDAPTTIVFSPPLAQDFTQLVTFGRLNDSELIFMIGVSMFLYLLRIAIRRGLDPFDMIVGEDGKLSWSKVLACTVGVTATWVVVHAEVAGTLTEWLFNGYLGLGLGAPVLMKYLATRFGQSSPPSG